MNLNHCLDCGAPIQRESKRCKLCATKGGKPRQSIRLYPRLKRWLHWNPVIAGSSAGEVWARIRSEAGR